MSRRDGGAASSMSGRWDTPGSGTVAKIMHWVYEDYKGYGVGRVLCERGIGWVLFERGIGWVLFERGIGWVLFERGHAAW